MFTIEITQEVTAPDTAMTCVRREDAVNGDFSHTAYAWIPAPPNAIKTVTKKVLVQSVETLDLTAVIRAINGI